MVRTILTEVAIRTIWFSLLLGVFCARALAVATPEELRSFDWWVTSAQRYAERIKSNEDRSNIYYALAYVQIHAGDLAGAGVSAAEVTDTQKGVYIHTAVAGRYHQRNDVESCRNELQAARETATATEQAKSSNFVYSHLIRTYVALGMAEEAKRFAEQLPPWVHRDGGLILLAAGLAEQGRLEEALDVAKNDVSEKSRESAFIQLAQASAGRGLIEETHRVLELVRADEPPDQVRAKLVESLLKAGRTAEAAAEVEQIQSAEMKARANALVLEERAKGGQPEAIAAQLEQVTTRDETLALSRKLIEKLAHAGKIEEAEQAIEGMVTAIGATPRPEVRSAFGVYDDSVRIVETKALYLEVARELAKRGDLEGAKLRVAQATESILSLAPMTGLSKSMLVQRLVNTQIEIGDLEGARTMLKGIEDPFPRSMPAGMLAAAFAKSGDVRSALDLATMIEGSHGGKGTYHRQVLEALVERGEILATKQVLAGMVDPADQESAYRTVGRAMTKSGRGAELDKWLPEMPSNVARAAACMGAAEAIKPPNIERK